MAGGSNAGNAQNAIPVYLAGSIPINETTNGYFQIKTGGGVASGFNVNTIGTTSTLTLWDGVSSVVTISIASPAVITWANHNLLVGDPVVFQSTGSLPTGITAGTTYYVSAAGYTTGAFQIADTAAHAIAGTNSINTSGSQSGKQTAYNEEVEIGTFSTTATGLTNLLTNGVLFMRGLIAVTAGGAAANLTIYYR